MELLIFLNFSCSAEKGPLLPVWISHDLARLASASLEGASACPSVSSVSGAGRSFELNLLLNCNNYASTAGTGSHCALGLAWKRASL